MSASVSASPGGQPSTTQPIAGPCDSPKDVTANSLPIVLPDMDEKALGARAAATPGLIVTQTALAQQKVPPASVKYQDKPNGKQQCNNCLQFVPGSTPTAMGTCKVVDGTVSPSGYCIIWVAKP